MKHLLGTAALAALIAVGSTGYASASTIALGSFSGDRGNNSGQFGASTDGSFDDLFTFTVTKDVNVSISVTNAFSGSDQIINPFTLSLYDNIGGTGTAIATGDAVTNSAEKRQTASVFKFLNMGSYSFSVAGDSGNSPSYGGSISVSVSPVPLPASAPLLGGAILVLGVLGYATRRNKTTSVAL